MGKRLFVFIIAIFFVFYLSSSEAEEKIFGLIKECDSFNQKGDGKSAIKKCKDTLALAENTLPIDNPSIALILNNLGVLYTEQGHYNKAEPILQRALAIREKIFGPDHPDVAKSLHNLALLYRDKGLYVRAESLYKRAQNIYEEALDFAEKTLPADNKKISTILNNLTALYRDEGLYNKAESLYPHTLAIMEEMFGHDDINLVLSLNNLALLYQTQGLYAKAEALFYRALTIREKTLGSDHPNVSSSLAILASLYKDYYYNEENDKIKKDILAKAKTLYQRWLDIYKNAREPNHPVVITGLINFAELFVEQGHYEKAEPLFQQALNIYGKILANAEKTFSANYLKILSRLDKHSWAFSELPLCEKAEPLYKRTLAIREKVLGPHHPDVAKSLDNLGILYREEWDKQKPLFRRALEIREKALGPDHPDVAESLDNIGGLYFAIGQCEKAEPLFQRVVEINKKVLSPNNIEVIANLNQTVFYYLECGLRDQAKVVIKRLLEINKEDGVNFDTLIDLYIEESQYDEVELLYEHAITIQEKLLDPNHLGVAQKISTLADRYRHNGGNIHAEVLYRRALTIREKALGSDHPIIAANLDKLASLYQEQGFYTKSEPLYKRALKIMEKTRGPDYVDVAAPTKEEYLLSDLPDHVDVATILSNLGELYKAQELYSKAEPLFQRALKIREKALGYDHPDMVKSINKFASLFYEQGLYKKAEPLLQQALKISEKTNNLYDVATILNNLGELYKAQELYSKAEPLFQRAEAMLKKKDMDFYHLYGVIINNLAMLYHDQELYNRAELLYKDVCHKPLCESNLAKLATAKLAILYYDTVRSQLARQLLQEVLPIIEKDIKKEMNTQIEQERLRFVENNRWYFDLFLTLFNLHYDAKASYNHLLKWKGVVLNSMKAQREYLAARAKEDPSFLKTWNDYKITLEKQSRLINKNALNDHEEEELKKTTEKRKDFERTFAKEDSLYGREKRIENTTIEQICSKLQKNSIILDYLKYKKRIPKSEQKKGEDSSIDNYLVFILRGGKNCTKPERVELGKAKDIEEDVSNYRSLFTEKTRIANNFKDPKHYSQKLMWKIWKPVEDFFGGRTKVWVIPDGALGGVSFQTLQTNSDGYLLDTYDIRYIDTGADLYRASVIKREKNTKTALLAGNIDVNMAKVEEKEPEPAFSQFKGGDSCRLDKFDDLRIDKATGKSIEDETRTIKKLLKNRDIKVYEADKASKSAVFEAMKTNPGIIHISTHGFYQSDECVNKPPQKLDDKNNILKSFEENKKVESDPMSRSGVVFAGVNNPEYHDQAIATGIDFSGLNLRKTDLFVLSACQSGMGILTGGEGVVGMRRALSMAGVKTVISTLWDAHAEITTEIMKEFYDGYLKTGKTHETMREIQKKYRKQYPDRFLLWGFPVVSGATE